MEWTDKNGKLAFLDANNKIKKCEKIYKLDQKSTKTGVVQNFCNSSPT